MFKNEYGYLIHLIFCAIHNSQPSEIPDNILFDRVFEAGKAHEVANIAFISVEKLHRKPNDELYKKWKLQYAFSMQRNINQISARDSIVDALSKHGIRSIELQGTVVKQLYPYAFLRNMSDIDFVIDKCNLLKAEKIMQDLGYKTKIHGDYDISAYANPKIAVELHSDFFDPNTEFYGQMTNPFEKAKLSEDCVSYTADDSDIFLYNILHCIKHFRGKGAGIRRMLDIYYLNSNILKNLDKESIFDFLKSANCKQDYDNLSAIADEWFGENGSKCNLDDIKKAIYISGTHGNIDALMLNQYNRSKNKKLFKLKKFLILIFPPKENIYSAYSFCASHRLPVFLCWIYRWCCVLFIKSKRKHAVKVITYIRNFRIK